MGKLGVKNLAVIGLNAGVAGKKILKNLNLEIKPGKIIALMGPNGSGKSTLAQVLAGNKDYQLTGKIIWQGKNIIKKEPWERARLGIFLSFQHPHELPGVNMYEFLSGSYKSIWGTKKYAAEFKSDLDQALKALHLKNDFLERPVNQGFSGGEKKRSEILQLLLLKPRIAILDETDSGLDIDSLKLIAREINKLRSPRIGFLVITHYQRLLNYLKPDEVQVMIAGQIVKQGDNKLVGQLERRGYDWLK